MSSSAPALAIQPSAAETGRLALSDDIDRPLRAEADGEQVEASRAEADNMRNKSYNSLKVALVRPAVGSSAMAHPLIDSSTYLVDPS